MNYFINSFFSFSSIYCGLFSPYSFQNVMLLNVKPLCCEDSFKKPILFFYLSIYVYSLIRDEIIIAVTFKLPM